MRDMSGLTKGQDEFIAHMLSVCDRSPYLSGKDSDPKRNRDFRLSDGRIEPRKNFCLAGLHTLGFSLESEAAPTTISVKLRNGWTDSLISVPVTIYTAERRYKFWGAASVRECDRGGASTRTVADAVERAYARALQSAIEAAAGAEVINRIIERVFGGTKITAKRGKADAQR